MKKKKYHLDRKKCAKLTNQIEEKFKQRMNSAGTNNADMIPMSEWVEILESVKPDYPWKKMDIIWTILDFITRDFADRGYVLLGDVEALCSDIRSDSVDTLWECLY